MFHELTANKEEYSTVNKLMRIVFVLSHGQAAVERGFSVNKEIEVENMSLKTLKAQRVICDHVQSVGGLQNVVVCKELVVGARLARQRYERYLEEEREKKKSDKEMKKRKSDLEEIDQLKKKRTRLESDINSLKHSSEKLYEKAEQTGKITFVVQGNSLKRTCKDKTEELEKVVHAISEKVEKLKE